MVKEFAHEGKTLYLCEICELGYSDRQTAQDCQNFCSTYGGCSLEITKKAVYRPSA